jgi:hypothetical protein
VPDAAASSASSFSSTSSVSPAALAFATLGNGRNFFWRNSSTMSAFLRLETTNSLLTIIFTKRAWFDSLSNCSCSSFARKSCKSKKTTS